MLIYGGVAASNYTTGARNSSAKLSANDSGRRHNQQSRSAKRGTAVTSNGGGAFAPNQMMIMHSTNYQNSRTLESTYRKSLERAVNTYSVGVHGVGGGSTTNMINHSTDDGVLD
jgi:L-cystine uptake protein TcyP (sodium:dicarboxylate symporter family)